MNYYMLTKGVNMNNAEFDFVNYDFESAVLERKTEDIQAYLDKLLESFMILLDKRQVFDLEKRVDLHKKKMYYSARKEIKNKNVSFAIGRYYGILEILSKCVDNLVRKERVQNEIHSSNFEKIPHLNDIISVIALNPGIRHGELAKKVGIERNTLTGIADRLVESDIITFSRPGKFKYYYLTVDGKKYYDENLAHFQEEMDIDYLIEQLLLLVSKSNTPSDLVAKILNSLLDGQHKFKEYKSNNKKKIDPLKFIPKIIATKPAYVSISNSEESMYVDSATIYTFDQNLASESFICFNNSSELANYTNLYDNEVIINE